MAARRAQAIAGAALGSMGLGAILWALLRKDEPTGASVGGGPPPSAAPAAPPQPAPRPADTAELDRNIVLLLDRTLPGTVKSYDLLRTWILRDPAAVATSARRYQAAYESWLNDQVRLGLLQADRAKQSKDILDGLGLATPLVGAAATAVGSLVSATASIPGIGSIIQGLYQIAKQFVDAAAAAAKEGKSLFAGGAVAGGPPVFTGYKDGGYYCWDIPVWSFTAPMWIYEFNLASTPAARSAWAPVFEAFERLATERPFGPPVTRVRVENGGSYAYEFNIRGTGDVSPAAAARSEVRSFEVWNPADITPTGPRGFDPANPWAWKRPGLKASVFDAVTPPGAPLP